MEVANIRISMNSLKHKMFSNQVGPVDLVAQSFQLFQAILYLQLVQTPQHCQVIQWLQCLLQDLELQAVRYHLGVLGRRLVPTDRSIQELL